MEAPSAADLKAKWQATSWYAVRDPDHPSDGLNLRVRRALSWLGRAEDARRHDDHDVAFILYWIAFNAAYGQTGSPMADDQPERNSQRVYIDKITALNDTCYRALRSDDAFREMLYELLANKFVYEPFWKHHNQVPGSHGWREGFDRSRRRVARELREIRRTTIHRQLRTASVLSELFARLYTLRNQLLHGGATWNSSVNRGQVTMGTTAIALLIPHFVDVMIENPDADWGSPRYPVVND